MRETRQSGSEGGARSIPCPYPYRPRHPTPSRWLYHRFRTKRPALNLYLHFIAIQTAFLWPFSVPFRILSHTLCPAADDLRLSNSRQFA
jgi:hypothetical protein